MSEEKTVEELMSENARLKQAYKYIHASRNSVDRELNEAQKENASLRDQLSKEREKYKDLSSSIQRHFQTLIARNYNNIGVWSNERQDYNFQLIKEIEDFLKEHNTKASELDKNK